MIKGVQMLKSFGIFDDYTRPAGTKDFRDRNVIYGWNYSGKTTLSRLFHVLNERAVPESLDGCRFSVTDAAGAVTSETNLAACALKIRVFNSDFIDASLNWNGKSFNPILLLGAEALDAQAKIEHYERVVARCSASVTAYRRKKTAIDERLAGQKTVVAKQIKGTLNIVEAFTATHLNAILAGISIDDEDHGLDQESLTSSLSLATASEKDRLPTLGQVTFAAQATSIHASLSTRLSLQPASSTVIEFLRQHSDVAAWVSTGLALHEHLDTCQFCLNRLTAERRAELHAHFSKELTTQRDELLAIAGRVASSAFKVPDVREGELNAQFRGKLKPLLDKLAIQGGAYNEWIEAASAKIDLKLKDPFGVVPPLDDPKPLVDSIAATLIELNALIAESNKISDSFAASKSAAIRRLKNHYAQQFRIDFKLVEAEDEKTALETQAKRYEVAMAAAAGKMKEQQARINRAQNGREKINERIAELLGTEAIHIEVRPEEGRDRFILMRNKRIARNLSEGEKTAIAFAFFLTKLLEDGDLHDVVVYIDDPISSLDSNHIFQVFSILKATFFHWEKPPNVQGKWITKCKQIFVSTHNFEFFQLLHDLPGETCYYLTKRVSPTRATLVDLPLSVARYTSEYHYLFHLLYDYHKSQNKADVEHLLALPNAARRFIELYTYAKLPLGRKVSVDDRAERLWGLEPASRILKVLHHFSHLESIERLVANTNLVADIDGAITALMQFLEKDEDHYGALVEAVTRKA